MNNNSQESESHASLSQCHGLPLRVLVSDRDQKIQDLLCLLLPKLGHHLLGIAHSGAELVKKCVDLKPDLVIAEAELEDMRAFDASQLISLHVNVPFIVLLEPEMTASQGDFTGSHQVHSLLIKPVHAAQIEVQIPLVMAITHQLELLRNQFREVLTDDFPSPPKILI